MNTCIHSPQTPLPPRSHETLSRVPDRTQLVIHFKYSSMSIHVHLKLPNSPFKPPPFPPATVSSFYESVSTCFRCQWLLLITPALVETKYVFGFWVPLFKKNASVTIASFESQRKGSVMNTSPGVPWFVLPGGSKHGVWNQNCVRPALPPPGWRSGKLLNSCKRRFPCSEDGVALRIQQYHFCVSGEIPSF